MATSSQTPNLRLVLPVTGELEGIWGDTVNDGLTSLVDSSVAGTVSVTVSDISSTVLTVANGATDQARYMFINLTGTISASRNVICPSNSKLYFVTNATTGGFPVQFKTSTSAGISIPAGERMALYCKEGLTPGEYSVVDAVTHLSAIDVAGTVSAAVIETPQIDVTSVEGTGTVTIEAPDTDEARTLTLPDSTTDLVGANTTQTLTNKTIEDGVYSGTVDQTGSQREGIVAVAALDIDCSLGNYFTKTINADSTFTFSNAPSDRAYAFTLELTHTSGVVTWPAAVAWPNGLAPSLDNGKTSLLVFITDDAGTRWRGGALSNYTT